MSETNQYFFMYDNATGNTKKDINEVVDEIVEQLEYQGFAVSRSYEQLNVLRAAIMEYIVKCVSYDKQMSQVLSSDIIATVKKNS